MTSSTESIAIVSRANDYPAEWGDRVPSRIVMNSTVQADFAFLAKPGTVALVNDVYGAYVTTHGAVCAILPNGTLLGVKPGEYSVVAWHDDPITVTIGSISYFLAVEGDWAALFEAGAQQRPLCTFEVNAEDIAFIRRAIGGEISDGDLLLEKIRDLHGRIVAKMPDA